MTLNSLLRSRYRNYLFLVPLAVVSLAYQITYTVVSIQSALNWQRVANVPFTLNDDAKVNALNKDSVQSGLTKGDVVRRINRRDVTGNRVLFEEVARHAPGQSLAVEIVSAGQSSPRVVNVPLKSGRDSAPTAGGWLLEGFLIAITLLCLCAGIYVALVRPDDIRALIVGGLLLSISQMVTTVGSIAFPEELWGIAFSSRLVVALWPIWMVLFGLYFPQRLEWEKRHPWFKWLVIGPQLTILAAGFVDLNVSLDRFQPVRALDHLLSNSITGWVQGILTLIGLATFFVGISINASTLTNKDSRRRLNLLKWGSIIGLTPLLGFIVYRLAVNQGELEDGPEWIVLTVCFLFFIFPITLVYVVVAERAMNVRMVLRQGVRYAMARGGIRVLFAVLSGLIGTGIISLTFGSRMSTTAKIATTAAFVIVMIIVVRAARMRMMAWLDRRFFRDAYNAEQLLEELSESVRTMVDEKLLFETVSRRISESLHVENVAVLLNGDGWFRPVYCLGLEVPPRLALAAGATTVDTVMKAKEPPRVYFDDGNNWIFKSSSEEIEAVRTLNSQLLLPVGFKERMLGMLSLGPKQSEEPYSKTDIQLLRSVALQTGLALENSRLSSAMAHEMAQRERLNREIEIAREVQERLFPQMLPALPGIDYKGACRPALGIGGDYYDFIALPNGDLGVAIGDVSGKGIAAALLMASLQASLRGQTITSGADLALLMTNVNRLVFDASPSNRYATFFYGQYNHQTRLFTYVNAGHNPPVILRRRDGEEHVVRLETGGPVVGLFRNALYQQATLPLEPGDLFMGFTDGISEAMNNQDEEWGEERMIPALAACADKSAEQIIPIIMAEADRFADGAPQHDDMTLIVVKLAA
jgi:phosphoserine phosphatase RsbU/P